MRDSCATNDANGPKACSASDSPGSNKNSFTRVEKSLYFFILIYSLTYFVYFLFFGWKPDESAEF
jgi:hypothetical protein